MKKYLGLGFLILVMSAGLVFADKPDFQAVDVLPSKGHASVTIPSNAIEIAPDVFSLGLKLHKGSIVEGIAFVDKKKDFSHKPQHAGNNGGTTCFSFLSKDTRWKIVEPYIVDPTNLAGLDSYFIKNNTASDIAKWEGAASKDILGNEIFGVVDGADTSSPDSKNEIMFADIADPGAIAVTIVWGIFSGPPFSRQLVEWDQVYDDVDFAWSSSGEAGKMDFENIATHEIGHSVGMGHPSDSCTEETMYRFADFGETKKRDLNSGDIAGVKKLYA